MKTRWAVGSGLGCVLLGLSVWLLGDPQPAVGGSGTMTTIVTTVPLLEVAGGEATYIGSSKCKKCHLAEHKSWSGNKHGKALETLMPDQAAETKTKHNLDPKKDYSTDATCLACHTVGFGKTGGYAVHDTKDEKAAKEMKDLAGVGCESCHGAGSEYSKLHEEIMKSKRKYKVEEMYAAGMTKIEEATCKTCHNDKGPTFNKSKPFDFAKMKDLNTHDHSPLKQRE